MLFKLLDFTRTGWADALPKQGVHHCWIHDMPARTRGPRLRGHREAVEAVLACWIGSCGTQGSHQYGRAGTRLTPQPPHLFQILNRGRRLTDLRLVFYTWELHQLGFGHSSRSRKALATEVPFSPLTTPLISVWPTWTFWALHKPLWTKHPETSFLWLQLSWADNAFLVSFPLTLSCFLLCYPANSDLLPQTLLLYSRKLLCSLRCVPDAAKWVFQGTVFTFLIFW